VAKRDEPSQASRHDAPSTRAVEPHDAESRREEYREAEFALDRSQGERSDFAVEDFAETVEFPARSETEQDLEAPAGEPERRGGRRRRRRRGRGKSAGRGPAPAREPETWDVESAHARGDGDSGNGDNEELDETLDASERQPTERAEEPSRSREHGRRRRRRRGGRRDGESREPSIARDDESDRVASAENEERAPQMESAAELEHDDVDDDEADLKANHRGIPTWDEAIGMIIGANMEARARNPSGSSGGQRGRRGHGRGRGHGR
jgi:hypothetical protein